ADLFIVLDASSSMEGYKWTLAVATTLAIRNWVNGINRVRTILFSDAPVEMRLPLDEREAWRVLMQVQCLGVTNLAAAASYALGQASSTSWAVFVTDGRANVGRSDLNMPAKAARLDVVLVGDIDPTSIRADGSVVQVREPGDIKNIFEVLAQ
ncbi:MAG: vWA domain-containing protein, partial [Thermoanaerobaculia bacterium]